MPGVWRLWPVRLLALSKAGRFRGTDVSASLARGTDLSSARGRRHCAVSSIISGDSRLVSGDISGHGDAVTGNIAVARPTDRSIVPLTSPGRDINGASRSSSTKGCIGSHVSSTPAYV